MALSPGACSKLQLVDKRTRLGFEVILGEELHGRELGTGFLRLIDLIPVPESEVEKAQLEEKHTLFQL